MTKIIGIINNKGGVGKTTTTCQLSYMLRMAGKRVLLIDADSQKNSTGTFRAKSEGEATLYDCLLAPDKYRVDIEETIQHTKYMDIIAGDELLDDPSALSKDLQSGMLRLKNMIDNSSIRDNYDYVLIDTHPVTDMILYNVLMVATDVIIPVRAGTYEAEGIVKILKVIKEVKNSQNPDINIAGILFTDIDDRTNITLLGRTLVQEIADQEKDLDLKIFDTYIRRSVAVSESQAMRVPLFEYKKNSNASKDYEALLQECFGLDVDYSNAIGI
ncbi:MAG: ParA family protein [Butyrivibrio sp.]|nr:ParA family protein [Butyrivibrio sp.]